MSAIERRRSSSRMSDHRQPVDVFRAQAADAARVAAIGRDSYLDHFRDAWPDPRALEHWLAEQFDVAAIAAEITSQSLTYLLAETRDLAVVGFAKVWHALALPVAPFTTGASLQKIYLRAAALGGGAGGALLDGVIDAAQTSAARFVWLDVLQSNARAIAFYRRRGFTVCGERLFQAGDSHLPMAVMRLELPQ